MRNSHFRHRVIKQYSLGLLVEENVGWWMTGADNVLMTTMHQTFFTSACGFHPRVGKIPLEEVIATIPIFLPGKSHGQRSLVGYSPWGCRVRHELETKQTKQKTSLKIALLKICGWTCFGNHFRLVKKYLREYNDFPCTINLGSPNSNIHIAMMYWLKLRN